MSIVERPGDRGILHRSRGIGWRRASVAIVRDVIGVSIGRALAGDGTPAPTAADVVDVPVAPWTPPGDLVAAAYEAYQREIHSFALRSTRDPEVAADVTQEAFLKLLHEVGEGRTPDNIRAWLYRVVTNQVINRANHLAVVDRVRRAWRRDEETAESPEARAIRAEQHERLRDALAALSRDARVGLLLAAQGFTGREVATAIDRTELATRTLLCRARLQLRASLTEGFVESEEAKP